jgi:hypothetical protein
MAQEDDEGREMGRRNHWFVFLYYILLIYNNNLHQADMTRRVQLETSSSLQILFLVSCSIC